MRDSHRDQLKAECIYGSVGSPVGLLRKSGAKVSCDEGREIRHAVKVVCFRISIDKAVGTPPILFPSTIFSATFSPEKRLARAEKPEVCPVLSRQFAEEEREIVVDRNVIVPFVQTMSAQCGGLRKCIPRKFHVTATAEYTRPGSRDLPGLYFFSLSSDLSL